MPLRFRAEKVGYCPKCSMGKQSNELCFSRVLVAFESLTRRPKIRLKRNFANIFDINAGFGASVAKHMELIFTVKLKET